ncbi:unnamed protein product [Lactuca virosa]|uniref:Uncharacterized protein n=1 Tax=Lactuca virosa TaxID=75947 RepID=A0AAU9MID6_9ASTR|nr:unnamed protein product [Lactuca virosa]
MMLYKSWLAHIVNLMCSLQRHDTSISYHILFVVLKGKRVEASNQVRGGYDDSVASEVCRQFDQHIEANLHFRDEIVSDLMLQCLPSYKQVS